MIKNSDIPVGDSPQNDDHENFAAELLAPYQFEPDYHPSGEERCLVEWLNCAIGLQGKSPIRMAMLLTRQSMRYGRTKYLMITEAMLAEASLSRISAYEALNKLKSAGLITVDRCQGRSPRIAILKSCI